MEQWPSQTDVCCWYCFHPFDSIPVPLPIKYDDRRNIFDVMGYFCSFGCAKTYNLNRLSVGKDRACTLLSLLKWKILLRNSRKPAIGGVKYSVKAAPNRNTLKMFGGSKTIEEFRDGLEMLVPSDTCPEKL